MTEAITSFSGKYRWLSNFYPVSGSEHHATVEHRFQCIKAATSKEATWVRSAPSPTEAKRRGRQVAIREDWEQRKNGIMELCVRDKFAVPKLRRMLLATGDAHLEEDNTWGDRYWGTVNGVGENILGRILMKIRAEIQAEETEWD
jgi:hypothetical protein